MTNQTLKKIKDNLPIIVIIPALLGGLWQIISLSNISISYIRFFSVTQVIPDGLLFLLILSIIIIQLRLVKPRIELTNIKSYLFSYLISAFLLFFFHSLLFDNKIDKDLGFLLSYLLLLTLGIQYFYYPTKKIINKTFNKINASSSLYAIILLISFWFISKIFIFINQNFTYPKDIENLINIERVIKLKFPQNKGYKIEYMNDEYIFIELTDTLENKTKIILEFNSLFNYETNEADKLNINLYQNKTNEKIMKKTTIKDTLNKQTTREIDSIKKSDD